MTETNDEDLLKLCDGVINDAQYFHVNANVLTIARALRTRLQSVGLTAEEQAAVFNARHSHGGRSIIVNSLLAIIDRRAIGMTSGVEAIFERIKHGDEKHQEWLRNELYKLVADGILIDRLTGLTQRTGVDAYKKGTLRGNVSAQHIVICPECEDWDTNQELITHTAYCSRRKKPMPEAHPHPAPRGERRVLAGGQRDTEDGKPVETRSTDQRNLPSAEVAEIRKRQITRNHAIVDASMRPDNVLAALANEAMDDCASLLRILGERKVDREKLAEALIGCGTGKHDERLKTADALIAADIFRVGETINLTPKPSKLEKWVDDIISDQPVSPDSTT